MALRDFMSNLGAMSKEGHESFMKYLNSYDRKPDWEEVKSALSPAFMKFLRGVSEEENE